MFTIWSKFISLANFGSCAHAGKPTIAASGIIISASLQSFSNSDSLRTSPCINLNFDFDVYCNREV